MSIEMLAVALFVVTVTVFASLGVRRTRRRARERAERLARLDLPMRGYGGVPASEISSGEFSGGGRSTGGFIGDGQGY